MFCKIFHLCVQFPLIFLINMSQPRGYRERSLSPMFENDSSHTFSLVFLYNILAFDVGLALYQCILLVIL